jgi:hypothetical protein
MNSPVLRTSTNCSPLPILPARSPQEPRPEEGDNDPPVIEISRPRNLQPAPYIYSQSDDHLTGTTPSLDSVFENTYPSTQSPAMKLAADFNSLAQQLPSIWSFEYQMGPEPYANALSGTEDSCIARGLNWIETNSPFSDHIQTLQRLLKGKVERNSPSDGFNVNLCVDSPRKIPNMANRLIVSTTRSSWSCPYSIA